jgi:hypothetical protein
MLTTPGYSQQISSPDSVLTQQVPLFSQLHTLSIHIREVSVHDSLFIFLKDKLKLPVYYYPVKLGERSYAGVYAGNLVLEPCGPYSNFSYASGDFKAIFFGLTFEPYESLSLSRKGLEKRKINYVSDGSVFLYPRDSILCGENVTLSIMEKADSLSDRNKLDSLKNLIEEQGENSPGIEYVKEIWIGYKDIEGLNKWKQLIEPSVLKHDKVWHDKNMPEIHFVISDKKEVKAIVFKVRSLKNTRSYFEANNLSVIIRDKRMELNKSSAFGLSLFFDEK